MTSSTIPKITAHKAFQQKVDREIKTIKSDIEKNGLKLANKIGEDAKMTPKITTKLVIQMAAVTQRISNLEDNLQEDKNTALVNRLKKLEHESANSNIIAIISFLQILPRLLVLSNVPISKPSSNRSAILDQHMIEI